MGRRVIRRIRRHLRDLPGDRKSHDLAREVLRDARSILEVVESAGYELEPEERKFFNDMPPLIGGALRGAILDSIEPSNRSRINFDVAYLSEGSGYTLTVSAPKRTGEIEVILQAPMPAWEAPQAPSAGRARAAPSKSRARKRASARKRRR